MVVLYGFSLLMLPGMIHAREAAGGSVPLWVKQFAIDASDSFRQSWFILFPVLILNALWWTIRARKTAHN